MITVTGLTKRYGALTAVDNLDFEVRPGQVLGFLGPNGAGKSTTMKMITGFIEPTAGHVDICGHDIVRAGVAAKRIIGYLPEGAPAYGEMSVREFLQFVAAVRGLRGRAGRDAIAEVVARLALGEVANQPIETLSKGFKRRVGLAQTLVHDPTVLVMDEPTDGLDPNQKHQVRALIGDLPDDKIVIISTHILEEVTAVCNRALIIARGRLLVNDTPANLLARSRYHNAASMVVEDPACLDKIRATPGVREVEHDALTGRHIALPDGAASPYPALNALARRGELAISDLRTETGRLEEVFRDITMGDAA